MATRFNRLRSENGHLFQERYKGLLIENSAALARVFDYVHLNPVRAKVVLPEQVADYRLCSLSALLKGPRPKALTAVDWLMARGGWADDEKGHRCYADYLCALAQEEASWGREGLTGMSRGWAIGTQAWIAALAKENAQLALSPGLPREERSALRQASWAGMPGNEFAANGEKLRRYGDQAKKAGMEDGTGILHPRAVGRFYRLAYSATSAWRGSLP